MAPAEISNRRVWEPYGAFRNAIANWGRRRHHNGLPVNPLIIFTGTELFARWHVKMHGKKKAVRQKRYRRRETTA